MNILVLSSHPDDETIGMGGTINKLSKQGQTVLGIKMEIIKEVNKEKTIVKKL